MTEEPGEKKADMAMVTLWLSVPMNQVVAVMDELPWVVDAFAEMYGGQYEGGISQPLHEFDEGAWS